MRIGVFDPYLDDLGGGEKYMMSLATCLAQDNNVSVFWDNSSDFHKLTERFGIDFSNITQVPNIFSKKYALWKKLLISQSYDAIIFLSDGSIPLVGSKKLFIHVQQPLEVLQHNNFLDKVKISRVTRFFCNSHYTQSFIEKRFLLNSTIIYPPVAIHAKKVKKKNIILHVGRFRVKNVKNGDYKKQGFMVETFKKMVDDGLKDWEFVLAVSIKDEEKAVFESLRKSVLHYPIKFYINKTNDELWDLYSEAKIYWHASGYGEDLEKHPEYAEHFGISTVEAMGAGCVPVVIRAGGQTEIVKEGENGLLWNTSDEMQKKTLVLTKDPKLLAKLSENAKKRANDFSYEKFTQAVRNLVI